MRHGVEARIGSGAVVIRPVPADSTAVGVPAKVVRGPHIQRETRADRRHDRLPDPVAELLRGMEARMTGLEGQLESLAAALEVSMARAGQTDTAL